MMKLRVAAAVTMAAGVTLVMGSPAYAWPGARVTCVPGHKTYSCNLATSGTPAPSTIRWYQDGFQLPAGDNLAHLNGKCAARQVVDITVKLTYVYSNGYVYKVETSDTVRCEGNQ